MNLSASRHLSWIVPVLMLPALSPAAFAQGDKCGSPGGRARINFTLVSDTPHSDPSLGIPRTPVDLNIFDYYDSNKGWFTSPFPGIDGLIGVSKSIDGGVTWTSAGTANVASQPMPVKLTFTILAADPIPTINGEYRVAPPVDGGAEVVYSVTGTLPGANAGTECGNSGQGGDPISTAVREYHSSKPPDLSLGGPLPLEFRRYYGSVLKVHAITGSLGDNWMHNFEMKLVPGPTEITVLRFRGATISFTKVGSAWQLVNPEPVGYQLATSGPNFQFLDPRDNRIYTFSSTGSLIRIEDRNGNALTVTPSAAGPSQVSDGLGRSLAFTYSAAGNLTGVHDQTGRGISFAYSGTTLSSYTNANGKTFIYTYTSAAGLTGLMTTEKEPAGNTTFTQVFDLNGFPFRQTDSRGNITSIAYDTPSNAAATVTDPLSNKTVQAHGDRKNLTAETDPSGKTTTYAYDSHNRVTLETDRLGNQTATTYHDPSGYIAIVRK